MTVVLGPGLWGLELSYHTCQDRATFATELAIPNMPLAVVSATRGWSLVLQGGQGGDTIRAKNPRLRFFFGTGASLGFRRICQEAHDVSF